MTLPSPSTPTSTTPRPSPRRRRIKRGIVAGYIHDISPRHRGPRVVTPNPATAAAPAPATAPTTP